MSILDRLNGHLDDAALAALWTRSSAPPGTLPAAVADPHVARCAECRVRFDALACWMQEIRSDAIAEAEAIFTPERLAAQQAAIVRRLQASERPARVIAFPKLPSGPGGRSTPVRRWIATAAAAGLMVGVGLGQLMDLSRIGELRPSNRRAAVQPRPDVTAVHGPIASAAGTSEETLLDELEAAATPRYEALRAYDTLTPRAADFVTSSR